jgi:hypothetical protein
MHIVLMEGLGERFHNSIGLRAAIRSRANVQTHYPCKILCVMSDLSRTFVAELLDLLRNQINKEKPGLNRLYNQITDYIPRDVTSRGHITHDFPISTVHDESHPDTINIPAGTLDGIQTPAKVAPDHLYTLVVDPHHTAGAEGRSVSPHGSNRKLG